MFHVKPPACKENRGTRAAVGPVNALQWYLGQVRQDAFALQPWFYGVSLNTNLEIVSLLEYMYQFLLNLQMIIAYHSTEILFSF